MKNKRFWIFLGGIIVLGAAFVLLDFHATASHTQTEKSTVNQAMSALGKL